MDAAVNERPNVAPASGDGPGRSRTLRGRRTPLEQPSRERAHLASKAPFFSRHSRRPDGSRAPIGLEWLTNPQAVPGRSTGRAAVGR